MKHFVSKFLVTFVFLGLSVLPYVGPVFLVLGCIWGAWALYLLARGAVRLAQHGFEDAKSYPDID